MRRLRQAILCPLAAVREACLRLQGMKTLLWIAIAVILLPAVAQTQALPDAPTPHTAQAPAPPDAMWNRIEHFSDGEWIVVRTTSGIRVRCRFAGATDSCLFCDPPGQRASQAGYQFDRASVVSVSKSHPDRNWHPVLFSAMAIVGTGVGIAATRSMDDRGAAAAGLLSAGFVALVGLQFSQFQMQGPYGGYGYGLAFRPHGFGRSAGWPRGRRMRMISPGR